jgi:pimeloyl-ACP methyl ester carboxylesterase
VLAFGHPSVGINEACGPSLSDSLLGMAHWVKSFVKQGYAVALPDYEGLGSPGVHPYADAKTAGLNMIDAVRALRRTFKSTSDQWVAFGGSQGGAAAWAADEQAATYAPELHLLGAVAVVPGADLSGLVDHALQGTLTVDQVTSYVSIVEVMARLHPDFNRDDYRRGSAARFWNLLTSCSGPEVLDRGNAARVVAPSDLIPASPEAAERLRDYLRQWAVPQRSLTAPLFVVYAGKDTFHDTAWMEDAIQRACTLGGTVVWQLQPNSGHNDIQISDTYAWIHDRFEGKPVVNECP